MAPISSAALGYGCLAFLTIQNSALILTMRYSRTAPGPRYHTSTAVMLAEAMKCIVSLVFYLYTRPTQQVKSHTESTPQAASPQTFAWSILLGGQRMKTFAYLLVPSFLYAIQNNFQFIAVSNLEAATFQVLYQGKILTTAVCAIIFLGKKLSITQFYSIMILSAGVACASIPSSEKQPHRTGTHKASQVPGQSHSIGVGAVSIACFISGFAGVYTESILKKTQPPSSPVERHSFEPVQESKTCLLWLRNFQLSLSGLAFAAFGCSVIDHRQITRDGFWHGYTSVVWATIILQAIGGLVVALVITYADNILKGFATSISVIISTVASSVLWGFKITPLFLVGMVAVSVATLMYSLPAKSSVAEPQGDVGENSEEKAGLLEHFEGDGSDIALEKGMSRAGPN